LSGGENMGNVVNFENYKKCSVDSKEEEEKKKRPCPSAKVLKEALISKLQEIMAILIATPDEHR
jgi:hypothetical protein